LFVGTQKDNAQDALRKGRHYVGEKNGRSKLTEENVKEVLTSELNDRQLADKFGVTRSTISSVRRGESWQR
jgi:transcriptional regulator with XRE-family HTH domain